VRFVYVDEAGISANEPVTVVAGVMVHADNQWKELELLIADLKREYLPEKDIPSVIFHATDLFHGTGYFRREDWSKELRWEILEKLVSLPRKLSMPIILGLSKADGPKSKGQAMMEHILAYGWCIIAANDFMNAMVDKNEVATVVAENNNEARKHLKKLHNNFANPDTDPAMPAILRAKLPISRIIDTVFFANKDEAALLQIADVCAFCIQRYAQRKPSSDRFVEALVGASPVNRSARLFSDDTCYMSLGWAPRGAAKKQFAIITGGTLRLTPFV
jgi:hypothetical protein